jgi:uncharacterized membrane protein
MTTMTTLRTAFHKQVSFALQAQYRPAFFLVVAWILAMVGLPIARWTFGDDALPIGINVAAILQASAVFLLVRLAWGWRGALTAFAIVGFIGWGAEFIGHNTGFPFGDYVYTDILQPQIAGVPLLIPVAWFMLMPSAWVMAQLIVGEERTTWLKKVAFVAVSAMALTAWDLFLDPQMVGWGFWQWAEPSGYFGIPWSNYAGWLLVAGVMTALVRPRLLPSVPFTIIYGIVWFLQTVGQAVFWGQVGPALVGSLAMGGIMLLAYWRSRQV